jgi:hypothetical protein
MSLAKQPQLQDDCSSNPFVSFDSNGVGLSRVYDDEWDYTSLGQNQKKVIFTMFDKIHRTNVQTYVAKLLEYYKKERHKDDNHISVSWLNSQKRSIRCIVIHWGKSDFSLLSDEREWRDVKTALKDIYCIGTLSGISGTINNLTAARLANRYVCGKEMNKLAVANAKVKQAIALPLNIHAQILQKVVNTVETYHSWRTDISEVMAEMFAFKDEQHPIELKMSGVNELSKKELISFQVRVRSRGNKLSKERGIPKFKAMIDGNWINDILRDCLMTVVLFSGTRKMESLSMNPESYDLFGMIPTLTALTSKGNDGQPVHTTWQTHPIALMALELAYDMTQFARNIHKNTLQSFFDNGDINKDRYERDLKEICSAFVSASFRSNFSKKPRTSYLAAFNGLNLKSFNIEANEEDVREFNTLNPAWVGRFKVGNTLPKLSLHDFRRSFAVFMVRNRLGNLQTIKYQFKHKNLQMSGWYANNAELARIEDMLLDSELMDLCDSAMENAAVDAFDEIYNKSEMLSGPEGERVSKIKQEALRKGEQVYMSRDELRILVKGGEKSIVMLPTGTYCTNSTCERLCSITYFHTEDKPCDHQIITDKGAKIQARERGHLIQSFRGMNEFNDYAYASILAGLKEKILYVEKTLTTHHIDFEPFTDKIKAVAA